MAAISDWYSGTSTSTSSSTGFYGIGDTHLYKMMSELKEIKTKLKNPYIDEVEKPVKEKFIPLSFDPEELYL